MRNRYAKLLTLFLLVLGPRWANADTSWLFVSLIQDKIVDSYHRDIESGRITRRSRTEFSAEPGVLTVSPDLKILFVALRSTGELASCRMDHESGELSTISTVPGGADPCYFAVDATGRYLLTAYYVANQITVHKINMDGSLSPKPLQVISTAKNAHAIELDKTNRMAFAPHTGGNQIFQFRFDQTSGHLASSEPTSVRLSPGDEPRHIALHPSGRWAYANSEAGDSLNVFEIDSATVRLKRIQTLPTIPASFDGGKNATARCEMTKDGRFVYVANRGHDSLSAFRIDQDSGRIESLGQTPTEKTPRSFTISDDTRFLYAAGQNSGKVATYEIKKGGRLTRRATHDVGPMPWCVLAVDVP